MVYPFKSRVRRDRVHPNEEIARRLFSAFEANDMATIDAVLADDVVWNAPGRGVNSGIRRGKQQLFAGMGRLGELTDGTLRGDIHDLLASDDHAVVLQTTRGERAGMRSSRTVRRSCSTSGTTRRGGLGAPRRPPRDGRLLLLMPPRLSVLQALAMPSPSGLITGRDGSAQCRGET